MLEEKVDDNLFDNDSTEPVKIEPTFSEAQIHIQNQIQEIDAKSIDDAKLELEKMIYEQLKPEDKKALNDVDHLPDIVLEPVETAKEIKSNNKCVFIDKENKKCKKKSIITLPFIILGETKIQPAHLCEQHYKEYKEANPVPKYSKEVAADCLLNLQAFTFVLIEQGSEMFNVDMKGLALDINDCKLQYKEVFMRMYEEMGPQWIDQILSPVISWIILSGGQIASRYARNKKNIKSEN